MPPEASLSQSAIYSARPTIEVGGQPSLRVSHQMTSMRMEESEGGLSTMELHFTNWVATEDGGAELAFGPGSPLTLGASLRVGLGDLSGPGEIFQGMVSAVEMVGDFGKPPELVVLAEDALTAARRGRRSKVYADMSPADVVRAVAGELSLTPVITGLDGPVATWAQLNETDLSFLRRLLARFDADQQVVGAQLHVSPRKDVDRGVIPMVVYSQLKKYRVTADLADQVTAVTVAGWNAQTGSAVKGEASRLANAGPGRGKSGLAWADDVFGSRSEHLSTPAVATDDEARAVAEAALDQRARRFVRLQGESEGNQSLRVGATVDVQGISREYDNRYHVVRTCHRFDGRHGYCTEFSAECAFLGP